MGFLLLTLSKPTCFEPLGLVALSALLPLDTRVVDGALGAFEDGDIIDQTSSESAKDSS